MSELVGPNPPQELRSLLHSEGMKTKVRIFGLQLGYRKTHKCIPARSMPFRSMLHPYQSYLDRGRKRLVVRCYKRYAVVFPPKYPLELLATQLCRLMLLRRKSH